VRRAAIIVLDGVGIGEAPDTAAYGDTGSNTLGNLSRAVKGMNLPNLQRAGLGNIAPLEGIAHLLLSRLFGLAFLVGRFGHAAGLVS